MNLKGEYNGATSYSVGDVVRYTDGVAYLKFKPCPSGIAPVNTLYWTQIGPPLQEAVDLILDYCTIVEGKIPALANNLTTTTAGKALDARQGKALKTLVDACLTADDIEDGLTSESASKALSAKQGGVLKKMVTDVNPDIKTIRLASSTASSEKIFDITVDDSGELTATEYTPPAET